jgi:hypothetical protein
VDGWTLRGCFIYNPKTNAWRETGSLHVPRTQAYAALLADGRVLIASPTLAAMDGGKYLTSEIFDPATGTWAWADTASTIEMQPTLSFGGAVSLTDGSVLLMQGQYAARFAGGHLSSLQGSGFDGASLLAGAAGQALAMSSANDPEYYFSTANQWLKGPRGPYLGHVRTVAIGDNKLLATNGGASAIYDAGAGFSTNLCGLNNGGCSANSTCSPIIGGVHCACTTGYSECGTSCVSLGSDASNCGACGNVCPMGASCSSGACSCPSGQVACGNACAAVASDSQNCGACGNVCPSGTTCDGGGKCSGSIEVMVLVGGASSSFVLLSNPLDDGVDTISDLFASLPYGSMVYEHTSSGWGTVDWYDDIDKSWVPQGGDKLLPGQPFGLSVPNASRASSISVVFRGKAAPGPYEVSLPAANALTLVGLPGPRSGRLSADLGYPASDGDVVQLATVSGLAVYTYSGVIQAWTPSEPTLAVGQAFWLSRSASLPDSWIVTQH